VRRGGERNHEATKFTKTHEEEKKKIGVGGGEVFMGEKEFGRE
jgi:hypothetical protein